MKPRKIFIRIQIVLSVILISSFLSFSEVSCEEIYPDSISQPVSEQPDLDRTENSKLKPDQEDNSVKVKYLKPTCAVNSSLSVLIKDNDENILVVSGNDAKGMAACLKEESLDCIDNLVLTNSDGQDDILKEILKGCTVKCLYTAGNAADYASDQGITTGTADYFDTANTHVILYADGNRSLGVLIYTPDFALFIADGMEDMSVLKGHEELRLLSVLSVSEKTGLDENVLKLMDPDACIISGDIKNMSAFDGTYAANEGKFYLQDNAAKGISFDMSNSFLISGAVPKSLDINIQDEQINKNMKGTEQLPDDYGSNDEGSTDDISDNTSSLQKTNEQIAEEVKQGLWGTGDDRYNRLEEAGYDPYEVQRIVDETINQHTPDNLPDTANGYETDEKLYTNEETPKKEDKENNEKEKPQYVTAAIYSGTAEDFTVKVIEVPYGERLPELEIQTEEGKAVEGWYADRDFENTYDLNTPLLDNISLYPKIETIEYIIAFDANGGEGEMDCVHCEYGYKYELPRNTFTRTGYRFIGWSLIKSESSVTDPENLVIYSDRELVSNLSDVTGITEDKMDITLYAQWEPIYKVTWGDGQTITSGDEAEFFINADIAKYISAAIDTELLPQSGIIIDGTGSEMHAVISNGTTKFLKEGEHKISFDYSDGICEAQFSVLGEKSKTDAFMLFLANNGSKIALAAALAITIPIVAVIIKKSSGKGKEG